jgi:hypothetical protein
MPDTPSKTHSPATYPLFNVSMCRKPHSRSHKFPLFNVSANPLTDTLRKRGNHSSLALARKNLSAFRGIERTSA